MNDMVVSVLRSSRVSWTVARTMPNPRHEDFSLRSEFARGSHSRLVRGDINITTSTVSAARRARSISLKDRRHNRQSSKNLRRNRRDGMKSSMSYIARRQVNSNPS